MIVPFTSVFIYIYNTHTLCNNMTLKVYSIQVQGITCTNCAAKIKSAIATEVPQVVKTTVNVIKEKVYVTLDNDILLLRINAALANCGKPAVGEPVLMSGGEEVNRQLHFIFQNLTTEQETQIMADVSPLPGVVKLLKTTIQSPTTGMDSLKISVTYNCQIVKGREVVDKVRVIRSDFTMWNQRVAGTRNQSQIDNNKFELYECLTLVAYFMIFNMILPETGDWFGDILCFPEQLGIFSFFMIFNIVLTLYSLNKFAKQFVINAYRNYAEARMLNMETLIALGSMSALALFVFFMIRYSYLSITGQLHHKMMAMMQLIDALTSSTLIVLIVTIGKYLERKVKKKIQKMTEQIFPESQLFKDMNVIYIEPKNRKLMVQQQKEYDVSAIEKDDLLKLKPGRLLLDVIVISGKTRAIESIMTGSEDQKTFEKGDRIRSGSTIIESDSFAQVENVFEKSVLLEIGAQINMANNTEESTQMGIQAVCRKISKHFVKVVILLSAIVVFSWSVLLLFNLVQVPECDICWIIERGVGVLVASCPCALGLAVPSVIAICLNLAIKSEILIRKNIVIQRSKKCKIVAFDKTGTLFTRVEKIDNFKLFQDTYASEDLWQIVAVMQKEFRHPLAELLYKEAVNRCGIAGTNFDFVLLEKPKLEKDGITGLVRNKKTSESLSIKLGNKHLMIKYNIAVPEAVMEGEGATCIYVSVKETVQMATSLNTHSNLRPEAFEVMQELRALGKQVHILSGDSRESVMKLGELLGIPVEFQHPEQSAIQKRDWIRYMQSSGEVGVMMIGDGKITFLINLQFIFVIIGLNDISCLEEASIGVSINAKSELNLNAADIIILSENLHKIVAVFKLMSKSNLFINLNLFWAFSYNIFMLPIVAGLFYSFNAYVSPVWSSIAMSLSSVIVVLFSQLLACFKYDKSLQRTDNIDNRSRASSGVMNETFELKDLSTANTANSKTKYQVFQDEDVRQV